MAKYIFLATLCIVLISCNGDGKNSNKSNSDDSTSLTDTSMRNTVNKQTLDQLENQMDKLVDSTKK